MGYLNYELGDDEEVLQLVRRHWITLAPAFGKAAVSMILAFASYEALKSLPYVLLAVFIWILASILYIVHSLWIWCLDCYILTNQRIVDIDQRGIFRREVAEALWSSVQEVTYELNGPLETVLNYGTVRIRLMASAGIIAMEKIPDPQKTKDMISTIQYKDRKQNDKI